VKGNNVIHRYHGFTLIEILIVIAIIGILMAIMFPVLMKAHSVGQRTGCLSNLHQLAIAPMLYSDDHAEQFPNSNDSFLWTGQHWRQLLDAYVGNRQSFWCPADVNAARQFDSTCYAYKQTCFHADADISVGTGSIRTATDLAYHSCGTPPQTRLLSQELYPAHKILIYEWTTNHDATRRTMWDATGGHNVVFADGHAARVQEEALPASTLGDHDPNWTVGGLAGMDE